MQGIFRAYGCYFNKPTRFRISLYPYNHHAGCCS